jgi:hypothetical protein
MQHFNIGAFMIDEPGLYQARNGLEVEISEIKTHEVPIGYGMTAPPTFNCHGYKLIPHKKGTRRQWSIWAPDGRSRAAGKNPWDIVKKVGVLK